MFGGARYNRDRKRVAKLLGKQSAGEELSKRKQAKLNALSDITSGRHTDIEATLRANGCFDDLAPPDGGGAIDNMGDNIVDFGDITEL